jgi:predicted phosphodiesterase
MRILLLADLHFRGTWFSWLDRQSADLSVIAGDLLDGFHVEGLLPQMISIKRWCDHFTGRLALSSGNHDGNLENGAMAAELWEIANSESRRSAHAMLQAENWMDELERPGIVTDRRSVLIGTPVGSAVVTTIPFFPASGGYQFIDELWETGAALRLANRVPWIVLHHEPPADTLVGGSSGDPSLLYKIRDFQPDFVASGHIHGQPYKGSFADKIGATWCFNPGHPSIEQATRAEAPNHIMLDLAARTATWHAAAHVGRESILKRVALDGSSPKETTAM